MVIRMDALFLVDRDARKKQMTGEERLAARRQHAEVWAEEIRQECLKLRVTVLPKSALGKAITYTLNQWSKLRRCFDYGEVELSNNLAENSMRPVTLGRKNWLHVGSAKSGPKVAAIISIVESCRRLGLPVKDYMLDVLPGMDRHKLSEMAQLTRGRWSPPVPDYPGFVIRLLVVERVERFDAELQHPHLRSQAELLIHAEIPVLETGRSQSAWIHYKPSSIPGLRRYTAGVFP